MTVNKCFFCRKRQTLIIYLECMSVGQLISKLSLGLTLVRVVHSLKPSPIGVNIVYFSCLFMDIPIQNLMF